MFHHTDCGQSHMIDIVNSDDYPHLLPELRHLFEAEWEEIDPFESTKNGEIVPSPILALNQNKLVGGLAFTRYPSPEPEQRVEKQALWLNAVLVVPAFRNQGISRQLIGLAESISAEIGEEALYAYTNIPELYKKLGWVQLSQNDDHFVLKK